MGLGSACRVPQRQRETRRYLLDFGFTPDVYANNLGLMKIDLAEVDALIISHGHYRSYRRPDRVSREQAGANAQGLRLYTGGEDDFCHRFVRTPDGKFHGFRLTLDRHKLGRSTSSRCCRRRRSSSRAMPSRPGWCRAPASSTCSRSVGRISASRMGWVATPTPHEPPFHRRGTGGEAGAGSALARARDLFPVGRSRACGDQFMRPCRDHQHAAGARRRSPESTKSTRWSAAFIWRQHQTTI